MHLIDKTGRITAGILRQLGGLCPRCKATITTEHIHKQLIGQEIGCDFCGLTINVSTNRNKHIFTLATVGMFVSALAYVVMQVIV